jgi:hypothetical protein
MTEPILEINEIKDDVLNKDKSLENKPTPEDVEKAKLEFETKANNFNESYWAISTEENALVRAQYLLSFLNNRLIWQKNAWMGVLKLNEELNNVIPKIESKELKLFEVQYQALEFILYVLDNVSGMGVEDAKKFEKEYEFFMSFYNDVGIKIEEARKEIQEIEWLQKRWGTMAQGFFLEKEPEPVESKQPSENIEIK